MGRLRSSGFAAVAVTLALLALEGACRVAERFAEPRPREAASQLSYQQIPDGDLLDPIEGFPDLVRPERGLTDNPVVIEPPDDDELRVLVLGGSAVGGWSVSTAAAFPALLGDALEGARPGRVTVLNFGRTGFASPQLAYVLEGTVDRIRPDVVVVVTGNNERHDLSFEAALRGGAGGVVARRELMRASALARLIRRAAGAREPLDEATAALDPPASPPDPERIGAYAAARLARSLRRIAAATSAAGAKLVVGTVAVNHRHRPVGHEWSFMDPAVWRDPAMRQAYFALQFGSPERGLRALEGRDDLDATLIRGVLYDAAGSRAEADAALSVIAALEESPPPDANRAIPWLWARRLLEGPAASTADLAAAWHKLDGPPSSAAEACTHADLLWYAGDWEAARAAYDACRGEAFPYRADDLVNETVRRVATDVGATLVDLDALVRARSPHGVPGYELFYDYCHYTPRGNVLVGTALAGGVARALGQDPSLLDLDAADAAFLARWRDAERDDLELPRWIGVSADVPALAALRYGRRTIELDLGPPGSWEALVFGGNRAADRGSLWELGRFELAASLWCRAIAGRPDRPEPRGNLGTLLRGRAGAHLRGVAGRDIAERCAAGEDPWTARTLPSLDDF